MITNIFLELDNKFINIKRKHLLSAPSGFNEITNNNENGSLFYYNLFVFYFKNMHHKLYNINKIPVLYRYLENLGIQKIENLKLCGNMRGSCGHIDFLPKLHKNKSLIYNLSEFLSEDEIDILFNNILKQMDEKYQYSLLFYVNMCSEEEYYKQIKEIK